MWENDKEPVSLQKVTGINIAKMDYFSRFWFSNEELKCAIEHPSKKIVCEPYEKVFPKYKSSEGFTIDLPNYPESTSFENIINHNKDDFSQKWARLIISSGLTRFIVANLVDDEQKIDEDSLLRDLIIATRRQLPASDKYEENRPVDLSAETVFKSLTEKGLHFPWHVIAAACSALNAGKHVIFTGPPGCGKTVLANKLAEWALEKHNAAPILATASQDWTTSELIGRYMPTLNGKGLEFRPGLFLAAIEKKSWLIIDEFNRCDSDSCFGELFTVLSGQSVLLPFEVNDSSDETENTDVKTHKRVGIQVGQGKESALPESVKTYQMPDHFRLLATMNDADADKLNQLSYALRRRFAIIRLEAPQESVLSNIIKQKLKKTYDDLSLENWAYTLKETSKTEVNLATEFYDASQIGESHLFKRLIELFAKEEKDTDGSDNDLVDIRLIGIAHIQDMIRFVGEGIRASDSSNREINVYKAGFTGKDKHKVATEMLDSFLAMGLVLSAFPQLDALLDNVDKEDGFKKALTILLSTFGDKEKLWRIGEKHTIGAKLYVTPAQNTSTIRDFLYEELCRQFRRDNYAMGMIDDVWGKQSSFSDQKKTNTTNNTSNED
jgi:MoxR-like ATPase